MKEIMTSLLVFLNLNSFSQANDTVKTQTDKTINTVTFITTFDMTNATKDGYYLNGYIVNINYGEAQRLNGKKIKVTGKVTIVKGLKNRPKEYDKKGNELINQGRTNDTKHIDSPSIKILDR